MAEKREFVYFSKDGKPSKPVSLRTVMAVGAKRLVVGRGQWAIKKDDDELGRYRQRRETLRRFRAVVFNGSVGSVYRIVADERGPVFKCREIKHAVHVYNTNGNRKADVYWSNAKDDWGNVQFLGAYVCKRIVGSFIYSQHSYGNAVDIGASTMARLEDIARWAVAHSAEFDIQHVIVADRIWDRGGTWHHYTGEYHYHVHVDFDPNYSGGCGVRG